MSISQYINIYTALALYLLIALVLIEGFSYDDIVTTYSRCMCLWCSLCSKGSSHVMVSDRRVDLRTRRHPTLPFRPYLVSAEGSERRKRRNFQYWYRYPETTPLTIRIQTFFSIHGNMFILNDACKRLGVGGLAPSQCLGSHSGLPARSVVRRHTA